jgi:hypothetical protein
VTAVAALLDSSRRPRGRRTALQTSDGSSVLSGRWRWAVRYADAAFLAAEDTRDSLAAPPGGGLFAAVMTPPQSAVAPKALLALADLRPEDTDSLVARLETLYPESVYTLALHGTAGDRYRVVEDSLLRVGWDERSRGSPASGDRRRRLDR